MDTDFGSLEQERYSRQDLFKPVGAKSRDVFTLKNVLIAGCGGLGSVSAEILTRAGVGKITIIDRDLVELSNLQRQTLFDESDVREGYPKAVAAKKKLVAINSNVTVQAIVDDISRLNIDALFSGTDIVMDGTDNFEARFLINEYCVREGIPWIFGACAGSQGMSMTIVPGKTPCLQCVFDKVPQNESALNSETAGVIAPIVNTIAAWQCAEALKLLVKDFDAINRDLLTIDVWQCEMNKIHLSEKTHGDCPVCDYRQYRFLDGKYGSAYTSLQGDNAVQITPFEPRELDLLKLAIDLSQYGDPMVNQYMLRLEVDAFEITIFPNGRAVIKGTTDSGIARDLYNKYVINE
ncbi:MAG: ThiF family adenylyltransferase [candidate division KSB1 bacterium]|jgi:adenylyltransferase/sulfurtransferase|nr:ThiF family adenylyltransferase [candidate division KSB1 bacterium]